MINKNCAICMAPLEASASENLPSAFHLKSEIVANIRYSRIEIMLSRIKIHHSNKAVLGWSRPCTHHSHPLPRNRCMAGPPDQNMKEQDEEGNTEGEVVNFLFGRDILFACVAYAAASLNPDLSQSWHYNISSIGDFLAAVGWGLVPFAVTSFCVLRDQEDNPYLQEDDNNELMAMAYEQSGELEFVIDADGDDNEAKQLNIEAKKGQDVFKGGLDALQAFWLRPFSEPESESSVSFFLLGRTIGTGATEILIRGLFITALTHEINSFLMNNQSSGSFALFVKLAGLSSTGASEVAAVVVLILLCFPLSVAVQTKGATNFVRAISNKPRGDRAILALRENSVVADSASSERMKAFMKEEGLNPTSLAALVSGSDKELPKKKNLSPASDPSLPFKLSDQIKEELELTAEAAGEALELKLGVESKEDARKKSEELLVLSQRLRSLGEQMWVEGGGDPEISLFNTNGGNMIVGQGMTQGAVGLGVMYEMLQEKERMRNRVKGLMTVGSPEAQVASNILSLLTVSSLIGINCSFIFSGFNLASSFTTALVSRVLPIIVIDVIRRKIIEEEAD